MRLYNRLERYIPGFGRMCWYTNNRLAMIESLIRYYTRTSSLPMVWELAHPLRLLVRDPMDMWIAQECLLERVYEQAGVSLQNGWNILDIGGGIGDFALLAATTCPDSQIISCEPYQESFLLLQRNLALNGVTNVITRQVAIADVCGQAELFAHGQSSVYGSTAHAGERGMQVPVQGLDTLLDSHGWNHCDFAKMDCEGGEYAIVLGSSDMTLRRVWRWCLEYHNTNEQTHEDLARRFAECGFRVRHVASSIHPHTGYMYAQQPTCHLQWRVDSAAIPVV